MAGFIAKIISKRILGEKLENRFGSEDPYFEQVPATRLDGTPTGKLKKQRKALPPGISEQDGRVLTKVKRRAYRLDMSLFGCCGVRFGWGSVIGFIPAIGDVLDAFMAMMVVNTCAKVEGGLPSSLKTRMIFNVIIDFAIGLVPFIGDVADAAFRANTRNAVLLEAYLREKGKKNLRQSGMPVPNVDPSDMHEFDRLQSESPDHVVQQPARNEGMTTRPHNGNGNGRGQNTLAAPAQAKVRGDEHSEGGGFFGFGRRTKPSDLEAGTVGQKSGRKTNKPFR